MDRWKDGWTDRPFLEDPSSRGWGYNKKKLVVKYKGDQHIKKKYKHDVPDNILLLKPVNKVKNLKMIVKLG